MSNHFIIERNGTSFETPELQELTKIVDECQMQVEQIASSFEEINEEIANCANQYFETSSNLFDYGKDTFNSINLSKKNLSTTDGIKIATSLGSFVAGGVIKAAGSLVKKYKTKQLNETKHNIEAELIQQKKRIALVKLPPAKELLTNVRDNVVSRVQELYKKELVKNVSVSDVLFDNKVSLFKKVFALHIKVQYIYHSIKSVVESLELWERGSLYDDVDDINDIDIIDIVRDELYSWYKTIGGPNDWQTFVKFHIDNVQENIPVSIAFLFSEPVMVSNFVSMEIHCDDRHYSMTICGKNDINNHVVKKLLNQNEYYLSFIDMTNKIVEPQEPELNCWDLIVLSIIPILLFVATLFVFSNIHNWVLRILICIIFGIGIWYAEEYCYLLDYVDDCVPYETRKSHYIEECHNFESSLQDKIDNLKSKYNTLKI